MKKTTTALRRRQLDQFLGKCRDIPELPHGYIREIRDALGMTSYQLAKRLGVKQSTAMALEQSEAGGTISLKTLKHAAEVLGCKVVYALVPEKSLQDQVAERAHMLAVAQADSIFRTMALEAQSTTSAERDELLDELTQELIQKGGSELWK